MIPLVYLLLAWLILMGFFAIMTLLTVLMSFRHGVASLGTYASTGIFLIAVATILLPTVSYLFSIDWSQTLQLFSSTPISLRF